MIVFNFYFYLSSYHEMENKAASMISKQDGELNQIKLR